MKQNEYVICRRGSASAYILHLVWLAYDETAVDRFVHYTVYIPIATTRHTRRGQTEGFYAIEAVADRGQGVVLQLRDWSP